jgi:hypothetical protein
MFKSLMIAGSIALSALAMTTGADAKTRVGIYFGVPFYDYQVGPGWRYYSGYGWYDYGRYGTFHNRNSGWISCGEARRMVDRSGYDRVRTVECSGRTYTFRALNRRGNPVTVYVNARNGNMWRG